MVELVLSTVDEELLPHCYVAMRVGESQKIGRLSAERYYKFPETTLGEHKYAMLDVFQRVGGCTVSIKPKDGDQDLQVTTNAGNLNLRLSKPGYKDKAGKKSQPDAVQDQPLLKPKFEAAKDYLAKHNLEARLKEAMKAVINELPDDPVGFINNKMRETDDPSIIRVPPTDKPPFEEMARIETRQALEQAIKDGSLADLAASEAASNEAARKEAAKNEAAIEPRNDLRQEVRQVLLDASRDGSLPNALSSISRNFSGYYSNNFKGSQFVQSFAAKLFNVPDLVDPPSCMIEEEAVEFKKQIQEFARELGPNVVLKCKEEFYATENPPPRDGNIKCRQLPQVLWKLGYKQSNDELSKLMDELGVDENGAVSFLELLHIIVEKNEEEMEVQELIKAFKCFDRSGSGYVTCKDLEQVMTKEGDVFSKEEVDNMIREAGSTPDGKINYVDFSRIMLAKNLC